MLTAEKRTSPISSESLHLMYKKVLIEAKPETHRERKIASCFFVGALAYASLRQRAEILVYHTSELFVKRNFVQIFRPGDPIFCAKGRKYFWGLDFLGQRVYNQYR